MTATDPYATPETLDDAPVTQETSEPKLFSLSGRIGRLRYLAYSVVYNLIFYGLVMVAGALGAFAENNQVVLMLVGVIAIILTIGAVFAGLVLVARRLNDCNASGWFCLLMLVPLANLLLGLFLLFMPGTKGSNKYGAKPVPNTAPVIIGALVFPFFIIGIVAAVAIPAYSEYVARAESYEAGLLP